MERKFSQEKVEKEAKQILDKFAKALEKVENENELDFYVEREEFERAEVASSLSIGNLKDSQNFALRGKALDNENSKFPKDNSDNFKQRILENAPNHDDDFIIAEKGAWKK